ncbi:MAG: hypothetical protein ACKVIW_10885, partial [bacterium]
QLSSGRDCGMQSLQVTLVSLGVDLSEWWREAATGISADGTVITGSGFYGDNSYTFALGLRQNSDD